MAARAPQKRKKTAAPRRPSAPSPLGDQHTAFREIFANASLGIIISNREGLIEQANPFANRLFGYGAGELIGKKIEILVPAKLREKHVGHRTGYNDEPKPRAMGLGMDLAAVTKNGTEFPIEISLCSYETGEGRKIVSFVSDITARKKIKQELQRLNAELESKVRERTQELTQAIIELQYVNENLHREMEQRKLAEERAKQALDKERELNELKSRFVSMASHEFRTPLGGILSSTELIARYCGPQDEEKRTKHIKTIKASVHNLTSILNDFLSLDKLEAGRVESRPSSFDLVEFARDLAAEMQSIAKPGQRILHDHRGENSPVSLDKQLLRNVLINLVSNAIKYSPENKGIYFETASMGMEIVVAVRDEGMGIPLEDQKHLFERFFRAENVTGIQGTGLGLNIVKKYLDLMGGSIDLQSRENAGTTVTVKFRRETVP